MLVYVPIHIYMYILIHVFEKRKTYFRNPPTINYTQSLKDT